MSNDDSNDDIKWLIERIESNMQSLIEDLQFEKVQIINKLTEAYPSNLVTKRNIILALVAFFASLIPTLAGFEENKPVRGLLMVLLIIDLAVGGAAYILLSSLKSMLAAKLLKVEFSYMELIKLINYLNGKFNEQIISVKVQPYILKLFNKSTLLCYGNRIRIISSLNQFKQSLILSIFRNNEIKGCLSVEIKRQESLMKNFKYIYSNAINDLNKARQLREKNLTDEDFHLFDNDLLAQIEPFLGKDIVVEENSKPAISTNTELIFALTIVSSLILLITAIGLLYFPFSILEKTNMNSEIQIPTIVVNMSSIHVKADTYPIINVFVVIIIFIFIAAGIFGAFIGIGLITRRIQNKNLFILVLFEGIILKCSYIIFAVLLTSIGNIPSAFAQGIIILIAIMSAGVAIDAVVLLYTFRSTTMKKYFKVST